MIWVLLACRAPLDLPGTIVTRIESGGESCGERGLLTSEPVKIDVTNRDADPRVVTIPDLIENAADAGDYNYVVPYADFLVGEYSETAELGSGLTVTAEVVGRVYCAEDSWPVPGRHRQDIPITSTDAFGGDAVEQALRVVVVME